MYYSFIIVFSNDLWVKRKTLILMAHPHPHPHITSHLFWQFLTPPPPCHHVSSILKTPIVLTSFFRDPPLVQCIFFLCNIGNMVLFLKRIPSTIGIWNAEHSRHRTVYFEWYCLDTTTENFPYWWRHYFVGPLPLSSYVFILQLITY